MTSKMLRTRKGRGCEQWRGGGEKAETRSHKGKKQRKDLELTKRQNFWLADDVYSLGNMRWKMFLVSTLDLIRTFSASMVPLKSTLLMPWGHLDTLMAWNRMLIFSMGYQGRMTASSLQKESREMYRPARGRMTHGGWGVPHLSVSANARCAQCKKKSQRVDR